MNRLRIPLVLAILLGVVLLLAACGGKGGSY
jgi:predicted small lipoprotein YifL